MDCRLRVSAGFFIYHVSDHASDKCIKCNKMRFCEWLQNLARVGELHRENGEPCEQCSVKVSI